MQGAIRVGLSSWLDKSLLECGKFYPPEARDAESKLRYYASQFPQLVEVDSTFYALPAERNAIYWNERTPEGFVFDVKIHGLFTQHPAPPSSLPKDIRQQLDGKAQAKERLYFGDLPTELSEMVLGRFVSALRPLREGGKLGAILLQFPRWFNPGKGSRQHLAWLKERLGDYLTAVEFRNSRWLAPEVREDTFDFLAAQGMAYVCVDEPQGYASSVPPLAVATHPELAYVRFHGRRQDSWEKPGVTVQERTKYLYSDAELQEWATRIETLAEQSHEVHVLMNTNYEDYAVRNARQLRLFLDS